MNKSVMESSNNIYVGRLISSPTEMKPGYPLGFTTLARENMQENHHNPSNVDQDLLSDGESGVFSISNEEGSGLFGDDGLIRVDEDDKQHQHIKQKFLSGLVYRGLHTRVEAVHKNVYPSLTSQARLHSFLMFSRVMEKKNEGCANVKYAWFGGSKDEIRDIFKHGPSLKKGIYGHGLYLSPIDSPLSSLQSSVVDEDGLRHLVLCRVILGRMEVVLPDSVQSHPSSEEFDSGVDDLLSPRNYIVWSTQVNTHILPQYVISFRCSSHLNEFPKVSVPIKKPNSPWVPFPSLISELAKLLPQSAVRMIQKHHGDHREKKITRQELIQKLRRIAGDDLLVRVIKSYRDKLETSRRFDSSSPNECKKNDGVTCVCSKRRGFNSVRRWQSN